MRKRFKWQICRILLPAALVPATLAGLAVSATQASAQALDPSTTMVQASPASAATGSHVITAAYNGDSNCAASNNTTTVDVTSAPASPSLIGPVLGDINIGNNYTYNDINSHNKSSVIKSGHSSIGR